MATSDAPVTPPGDTTTTPPAKPRKPRARKPAAQVESVSATSDDAGERECLIRRRVESLGDIGTGYAWLEVGTISARRPDEALDRYALLMGDKLEGGVPHEAVTSRYRLERTPAVEVQTTIAWS